jgi:hypothetical protein
MMELVKRIYRMSPEQYEEIQQIIAVNQTKEMRLISEEGNMDLGTRMYLIF